MIHRITDPSETARILETTLDQSELVIFDLALDVDPSKITVEFQECDECCVQFLLDMTAKAEEYCDEDLCEGYLESTFAHLVVQGDNVIYRRP